MARRVLVLSLLVAVPGTGCKDSSGPDDDDDGSYLLAAGGGLSLLYRVGLEATSTDSVIGAITTSVGVNLAITDLALTRNGRLWGVTFTELYRIDPNTAIATRIGGLGVTDMNALTIAPDGRLLGAGASGNLAVIDTVTGRATLIGNYGNVQLSGGDLAFAPDGRLFATTFGTLAGDRLAVVNPATGVATPVGTTIGFTNVWGLAFVENVLYALTWGANVNATSGVLLRIDTNTGVGTQIRSLTFKAYGTARPPVRSVH
jgi:sugar lactone lactonase YvrE